MHSTSLIRKVEMVIWLSLIPYFIFVAANYQDRINSGIDAITHQLYEIDQNAEQSRPIADKENRNIENLIGLFGKAESTHSSPSAHKEVVSLDKAPKSLNGLITSDGYASAVMTNDRNEQEVIYSDSISRFTHNSISVVTASGIRTIRLRYDNKGINIIKKRLKNESVSAPEKAKISKAELLRRQLLKKASSE